MTTLRSYLETNGNSFTRIYVFTCDKCSKEIYEMDPHTTRQDRATEYHFCRDCSFINGYIDENRFLLWCGVGPGLLRAGIFDGQIVLWNGDKPPWEMTTAELRRTTEYRAWRKKVLKRDDNTCKKCGVRENLHAHHIKEFAKFPALRFEVTNGITLCKQCHYEEHRKG